MEVQLLKHSEFSNKDFTHWEVYIDREYTNYDINEFPDDNCYVFNRTIMDLESDNQSMEWCLNSIIKTVRPDVPKCEYQWTKYHLKSEFN